MEAIALAFSEVILIDTYGFTALRFMVLQSIASISISSRHQKIRASKIIEPAFNFKFTMANLEWNREKKKVINASRICNLKMHWTVTNVKARRGPYLAITKSLKIKLRWRKTGGRKNSNKKCINIRRNFRNMHKICWRIAYMCKWNSHTYLLKAPIEPLHDLLHVKFKTSHFQFI